MRRPPLHIAIAVIALTASSWLAIPMVPVPITLQTLAVLLAGALLGPVRSAAAVAMWLALGAAGLPVFAGGSGGVAVLLGKTGGYLLAFPFAAMLVGWLTMRGGSASFLRATGTMLAGHGLCLAIGGLWLAAAIGGPAAWSGGVVPFLPGALLKSLAGAAILHGFRFATPRATEPA